MNKRLWIVFAVLVLITLGGLIFWKKTESSQSAVDTSSLDGSVLLTTEMVGDNQIPDHYQGNKDSDLHYLCHNTQQYYYEENFCISIIIIMLGCQCTD